MYSILYHYRTESYRLVGMWKKPFTDRDTDRYRFRVPTEFTDLPTLLEDPWCVCIPYTVVPYTEVQKIAGWSIFPRQKKTGTRVVYVVKLD